MFSLPIHIDTHATKNLLAKLDKLAISNQPRFLAKAIQYCGANYRRRTRTTVFGLWAPYRLRRPLHVEIYVPKRRENKVVIYERKVFPLTKFQTNLVDIDYANDFYFVSIKNLKPFENFGVGCLYRFGDPVDKTAVPDIFSYYQPFGVDGPSAIIDQEKVKMRRLPTANPTVITKIHVGMQSKQGTFSGLQQQLDKDEVLRHSDSLEFLPIGAFGGRHGCQLTYYSDSLIVGCLDDAAPVGWGYDGGPNFILSVAESYGQPDDLKRLINTIHARGQRVGFDIQLNHFGPEGVHQTWYGPYLSDMCTEWGCKPNFADKIVRSFLLYKLRHFVELYAPDHVRLDMSSRYGDDQFIKEICTMVAPIPVILEDERNKPSLTNPDGAGALARWSFTTVHNLESIARGNYGLLETSVQHIMNRSYRSVSFANSHDEQGNNTGLPCTDRVTPAIAMMTNGIPMLWYQGGFFHFFCNYQDPVQLVNVTAEKCGVLPTLPDTAWDALTPLHAYFMSFKECKEFFQFIHMLWQQEVVPYRAHDQAKTKANIQTWLNNNARLVSICEAYNQAISRYCRVNNWTITKEYKMFLASLLKLRKANPWLYGENTKNSFSFNQRAQTLVLSRQAKDKKMAKVMASLKSGEVHVSCG